MSLHPGAGRPAPEETLEHVPALVSDYFSLQPDPDDVRQRVAFGTSGHRGSSSDTRFNEAHIRAVVQAVCDVREKAGVSGPLYLGKDSHALSEPAWRTAIEVLVGNGVIVRAAPSDQVTPTPLVSKAILDHNRAHAAPADGLILTPSHNPPRDGGIKYNPPHGGPSASDVSKAIEARANALLAEPPRGVPFTRAMTSVQTFDYVTPYVEGLAEVVDVEAIRAAGLRLGADPLGGSALAVWPRVAERWGLDLEITNPHLDPTFRFMTLDHDGKIRMDCSSPHAMARLIEARTAFDVSFGTDADADRHGIVTPQAGLLNPNHFLAIAVDHLFRDRAEWGAGVGVGLTAVTSALVGRVAKARGRSVAEVPVGFKWFVPLLTSGEVGFAGEESAGATLITRSGQAWTTDKDGIALCLLAAEVTARTGADLAESYARITSELGAPSYRRVDAPASPEQKKVLQAMAPDDVLASELAGHAIVRKLTTASGQSLGGLKVETEAGWFAARPSGTEDVYKIYAESFEGEAHLDRLLAQAQEIVGEVFSRNGL